MAKKLIAFGDIHGVIEATKRAILLSEELDAKAIFLGDYVDRGKESIEVLQTLIKAKDKHPDWVFLMGNHDQMLLDLINGKENPGGYDERTKKESYSQWLELENKKQEEIKLFLEELLYYYETDDLVFVHAILRDTEQTMEEKHPNELIWNYEYAPVWQGKPFIHGHYPVDNILYKCMGLNINTSSGYGWGYLTGCLINEISFTDHSYYKITKNGELE